MFAAISTTTMVARAEATGESGACGAVRASDPWQRARSPRLSEYCELVAHATTQLATDAKAAGETAARARGLFPERVLAVVLEGRAAVGVGDYPRALASFRSAARLDPRSLDEAPVRYAYAIALRQTGARNEAVEAFRALLPVLAGLASASYVRGCVDAGLAIGAEGQTGLEDAIAALRLAVVPTAAGEAPLAYAFLALALDRAGRRDEASLAALEAVRGGALRSLDDANGPAKAYGEERLAALARLREAKDANAAATTWGGVSRERR